ncbi:MAG TPA: glycosyltransferase family 39 protein [Candidatus Binataceae bacterium]|nr:glycosyltransferase family 39 protein [Candidatus Binataceae bacterium]
MSTSVGRTGYLKIWSALGLALFLRALFPVVGYCYTRDVTIFYTPDTASYIAPARELIAHHRFSSDGAPEIARTPGYPLLLTVGLLLGRVELVTVVLQILLSCFTVYMVYRTALLLFERERVALVAALLYAIEPFSILFTSLLSTETLFAAIVMVGVYYLVRYLKRHLLADLLASAVALAVSVYVRPIGYFLPVIIAAGLAAWALATAQRNRPRLIIHLGALVIVSFGLTGLWQVRNKIEAGYSGFSAIASQNMYFILASSVLAVQQHAHYYQMRERLGYQDQHVYFRDNPGQHAWPMARVLNYMSRDAEHILLGSPWTYAQIYFQGVVRSIFDPGSTEFLRFFDLYPKHGGLLQVQVDRGTIQTLKVLFRNPLLGWSTVVLIVPQFIYLWGLCVTLSRRGIRDPAILAALLIIGYYVAIAGGPGDWGRFRHPAMPIVCALAAYGLTAVAG